jgi:Skp family chaperone for outer membrane proteins
MIKIKVYFYLFFFLLLSSNSYSKNNVYYIDIDYVLTNTIIGKSLLTNLKEEEKLIINKIKDNDEKFKTEEQKILAKKNLISNEELSREMQSLRDKFKEYKKNKDIEIEDFKKKKEINILNLLNLINPIIEKYMADNSINILLDKKNIFIANNDYDITNFLIELVDNQIKSIEIK